MRAALLPLLLASPFVSIILLVVVVVPNVSLLLGSVLLLLKILLLLLLVVYGSKDCLVVVVVVVTPVGMRRTTDIPINARLRCNAAMSMNQTQRQRVFWCRRCINRGFQTHTFGLSAMDFVESKNDGI